MINFKEYEGHKLSELKYLKEVSYYNNNYYIGLKREGIVCRDLIYVKSEDDNHTTIYYYIYKDCVVPFGYSYLEEDDIIHTDEETLKFELLD